MRRRRRPRALERFVALLALFLTVFVAAKLIGLWRARQASVRPFEPLRPLEALPEAALSEPAAPSGAIEPIIAPVLEEPVEEAPRAPLSQSPDDELDAPVRRPARRPRPRDIPPPAR